MRFLWACFLMAGAPATRAAAASPASPSGLQAAAVDAARSFTVADLYQGNRLRDPFMPLVGSGAAPLAPPTPPEEISIHDLELRGILKDRLGTFAILVEPKSGSGYLLRGSRLYDYKNKRVPGITGIIQAKQRTVILMTPDKDVQTMRMGEEELREDVVQ